MATVTTKLATATAAVASKYALEQQHRRIMLFMAANEAGGTAILYQILQRTKHPLLIYYMGRYRGESQSALHYLQEDERIKEAREKSDSHIIFLQNTPHGRHRFDADRAIFLKHYAITHSRQPLSYLFINGHINFGEQKHAKEKEEMRLRRLETNWAPWHGALDGCPKRDLNINFNCSNPYVVAEKFTSAMNGFLDTYLPLVKTDGTARVVIQTPRLGRIDHVPSKEIRKLLLEPTWESYDLLCKETTAMIRRQLARRAESHPPWPSKRRILGLTDLYARAAVSLYQKEPRYKRITFRRLPFNPLDQVTPVQNLLGEENEGLSEKQSQFSNDETTVALSNMEGDVTPEWFHGDWNSTVRRKQEIETKEEAGRSFSYRRIAFETPEHPMLEELEETEADMKNSEATTDSEEANREINEENWKMIETGAHESFIETEEKGEEVMFVDSGQVEAGKDEATSETLFSGPEEPMSLEAASYAFLRPFSRRNYKPLQMDIGKHIARSLASGGYGKPDPDAPARIKMWLTDDPDSQKMARQANAYDADDIFDAKTANRKTTPRITRVPVDRTTDAAKQYESHIIEAATTETEGEAAAGVEHLVLPEDTGRVESVESRNDSEEASPASWSAPQRKFLEPAQNRSAESLNPALKKIWRTAYNIRGWKFVVHSLWSLPPRVD